MQERRNNDVELLVEFKEFIAQNKQWQISTNEYRESLCNKVEDLRAKIDDVNKRIYKLPCDERIRLFESIKIQIKALWGLVSLVLAAIITAFFRRQ